MTTYTVVLQQTGPGDRPVVVVEAEHWDVTDEGLLMFYDIEDKSVACFRDWSSIRSVG